MTGPSVFVMSSCVVDSDSDPGAAKNGWGETVFVAA
jgi:hypothetical protein